MFTKIHYYLKRPGIWLFRKFLLVSWIALLGGFSSWTQNVIQVEYFIDTDPGYGLATNVSITPGTNLSGIVFPINVAEVTQGFHSLFIRSKDEYLKWSLTAVRSFFKEAVNMTLSNVTKIEYFIDIDPGHGLATNVPITPSTNLSNLVFLIDIDAMPPGFHNLYIRAKDAYEKWGLTAVRSFYKENVNIPLPNVTKVEYFIDTDPGIGLGTNVPVPPGTNLSNLNFLIDLNCHTREQHEIYIRARDFNGKWCITNEDTISYPGPTIIALGSTNFCQGSSVQLKGPGGLGRIYKWHKNNTPIPDATDSTYVASEIGDYYVQITLVGSCTDTSNIIEITYNTNNPVPTIIGPVEVCSGDEDIIYSTEPEMQNYQWTISPGGTITSGSTQHEVLVNWDSLGGRWIQVQYSDTNGCITITPTQLHVSVDSITIPGGATGGSTITFGYPTDTLVLKGYYGSIMGWQKRHNGGIYSIIPNTAGICKYIETPDSLGTWDYQANVQNGVCALENSSQTTVIVLSGPIVRSWIGGIDENWNKPGNWNPTGVPTEIDDVLIPSTVPNMPVVKINGLSCHNILIKSGASVTVNPGKTINVTGTITIDGQ